MEAEDPTTEEITTEEPTDYSTAMTAGEYLAELEALFGFNQSKNNWSRT
jgi:hypothetical protein